MKSSSWCRGILASLAPLSIGIPFLAAAQPLPTLGPERTAAVTERAAPLRAMDTVGPGSWRQLAPPPRRRALAAVYHPPSDALVMIGGYGIDSQYRHDVWIVPLATPSWNELAPAGPFSEGRGYHSLVYDSQRDRVLMFGGHSPGGYLNDVSALSLSGDPSWTILSPAGSLPEARYGHGAIYDPVRDRMIVYGGVPIGPYFLGDLWELTLSGTPTWTQLSPAGPTPGERYYANLIYDPVRDRMLLFGGNNEALYYNDVWELSLSGTPTWAPVATQGTPPSPRTLTTTVYDSGNDRLLVYGGYVEGSGILPDLVWALSLSGTPTWTEIQPPGQAPIPRVFHGMIYDPIRERAIVLAGSDQVSNPLNDLWSLPLDGPPSWSMLLAPDFSPPRRASHSAIYDPESQGMVVFGGSAPSGTRRNDVWRLSLASETWTELLPTATPPSARLGHSAIYDPIGSRMIVFAGNDGAVRNDLWTLSLQTPAWAPLVAVGTPPPVRDRHTCIYDAPRQRMIVFGGRFALNNYYNDVWELSLSGQPTWTQLFPTGTPPNPRNTYNSAIFDPINDRLVLFGGSNKRDVWALSLAGTPSWTQLPLEVGPSCCNLSVAIYDPVRSRMVMAVEWFTRNETWAIVFDGAEDWEPLTPYGPFVYGRNENTAIYDPPRDRMVLFGGRNPSHRNDVWFLGFSALVAVGSPSPTDGVHLGSGYPNPTVRSLAIPFTLDHPSDAALSVYDLAGRRLRTLREGPLAAGAHTVHWDGRTEAGIQAAPGVYLLELRVGTVRQAKRFVLTK